MNEGIKIFNEVIAIICGTLFLLALAIFEIVCIINFSNGVKDPTTLLGIGMIIGAVLTILIETGISLFVYKGTQ